MDARYRSLCIENFKCTKITLFESVFYQVQLKLISKSFSEVLWTLSTITSQNKNGGDMWETLYREPMERLVLCYKKSKNFSGEAYVQSSNTNSLGII